MTVEDKEEGVDRYDALKLENQLCFPLYACAKEVVRRYGPLLSELDLTYTQYIAMLALWEHRTLGVKELGSLLYLDSGTLTPLLKKLEAKGYVTRCRCADDERKVSVTLTDEGLALRDRAVEVPRAMVGCIELDPADARALHGILHRFLDSLAE